MYAWGRGVAGCLGVGATGCAGHPMPLRSLALGKVKITTPTLTLTLTLTPTLTLALTLTPCAYRCRPGCSSTSSCGGLTTCAPGSSRSTGSAARGRRQGRRQGRWRRRSRLRPARGAVKVREDRDARGVCVDHD